jgi:hypothetical protein
MIANCSVPADIAVAGDFERLLGEADEAFYYPISEEPPDTAIMMTSSPDASRAVSQVPRAFSMRSDDARYQRLRGRRKLWSQRIRARALPSVEE